MESGFDDLKDLDFVNSLLVYSLKYPVKLIIFLLAKKTDCTWLSTHDDYSVMSKLPK